MTPQGWKLIKELPRIWRKTPWWRREKSQEQLRREARQRVHDYMDRQWERY